MSNNPEPADSASTPNAGPQPGAVRSLWLSLLSWRTASVVLLSLSSGMPLGLVWIAIPDWMRSSGVDIRVVGLFTLAQAPWTFNVLWAPLMDRFRVPLLGQRLGRRRGWALLAQLGLALGTLGLAGLGTSPELPWIALALTLAIAFSAATQDIAVDAYAIDVLREDEQGIAVGARIAMYRIGMLIAGSWSITWAARWGWPAVCIWLALLYLPLMVVTRFAPEPAQRFEAPKSLRDAVWLPFIGFLSRHRALEILAFVLLFKFGDNFAQSLLRPFLNDLGYSALVRGGILGTISMVAVLAGSLLGSAATQVVGLGPSLWVFGVLQMVSNLGYVLLANSAPNDYLLYGAMTFENLTQGLGTGAFSVLLFRLTQKRFSATQYALFSTLFGLGRIVSGPVAGLTVDAVGWSWFYWITIPLGLPGLIMLWRFVPWGQRDPTFEVVGRSLVEPLSRRALALRGIACGVAAFGGGTLLVALLGAIKGLRSDYDAGLRFAQHLAAILVPHSGGAWLQLVALSAFGVILGLVGAALAAARRGAASDLVTG